MDMRASEKGGREMGNWFYNPENEFHLWGTAHMITILIALICIVGLFTFRQTLTPYRRSIRLTVGWGYL